MTLPGSRLLIIFELTEKCVQRVLILAGQVILEEVGGMHEQFNVDFETMIQEEWSLLRMCVDRNLRKGKPWAEMRVSIALDMGRSSGEVKMASCYFADTFEKGLATQLPARNGMKCLRR